MGALGDRKLKPTDERVKKQFIELCRIQSTREEICAVLDVSPKTLQRWCKETFGMGFSPVYKRMSSGGKTSLRRIQFKQAENSPSMAMFLGKVVLGQRDRENVHVVVDNGGDDPITKALKTLYNKDDSDGSEED